MFALIAAIVAAINFSWRALDLPGRFVDGAFQPWSYFAFTALVSGSIFAVVLLLLRRYEGLGPAAINMPFDRSAMKQTFYGILLGALAISLIIATAVLSGYGSLVLSPFDPPALAMTLPPLLGAIFVLAAWEELVLRGYVFRQLRLGINPTAAVLITGSVFGLLHIANPDASWQGVLYTIIGGVMMGWLLLRSGSLWLLIGYHFSWNATSSVLFGLDVSGFGADASILATSLTGPDILTGGGYGFEASLPAVAAEVLVMLLAIRIFGRGSDVVAVDERAAPPGSGTLV